MTTIAEKKSVTQPKVKAEKKVMPAEKASLAALNKAPKVKPKTATKAPAKAPASKISMPKVAPKAASVAPAKRARKPIVKNGDARVTSPATSKALPAPATIQAKEKIKRTKLVRDSFTMPETEYAVLSNVKKACISAGIEAKKSQLLRVGLILLSKTNVANLKTLLENLEPLKAGRPKKEK